MREKQKTYKDEDFNIKLVRVSTDVMTHDDCLTIKSVSGPYRESATRFHDPDQKAVKKSDLMKPDLLGNKVVIYCLPEQEAEAIALARSTLEASLLKQIDNAKQLLDTVLREPKIEKKSKDL